MGARSSRSIWFVYLALTMGLNGGVQASTQIEPIDGLSLNSEDLLPLVESPLAVCYATHLLNVARTEVATVYKNRTYSGGECALAVREDLNISNIDQGQYGDAINYYQRPFGQIGALNQIGFQNFINLYTTANSAPAGAVLVFAGPYSNQYLKTGVVPPVGQRHGHTIGDWVGHITVKGDAQHGDPWYYTDGRTAAPAIANRTLVGVYLMVHCPNCAPSLKLLCGDIP